MYNTCFAMITPDAVIRGKVSEIIHFLESKKIFIQNFDVKILTEREIEEVYKLTYLEKIEEKKRTHWWLTKASYAVYPAIVLKLNCNQIPATFSDLPTYIKFFKGKSDPYYNYDKESLRYELGSLSKTLALFHSSDDLQTSKREHDIFFKNSEDSDRIFSEYDILPHLNAHKLQDLNLYEALYGMKIRILFKMNWFFRFSKHSEWNMIFDKLKVKYEMAYQISKEQLNFHELFERFKEILDEELQLLKSNRENIFKLFELEHPMFTEKELEQSIINHEFFSLYLILIELSRRENFNELEFEKIFLHLREQDIFLDSWEEILVTNLLFFYPQKEHDNEKGY